MSEISEVNEIAPVELHGRSAAHTIARNTIFGIGAQIALKIVTFLFNVFVIRSLGGAEFGQYSIVLDWATLFAVLGDLGVTQYLAREIARDPSKKDELFWDTVVLRFFLAILASATTILGAIFLTDYSQEMIIGISLFTGTYFFSVVMAPLDSVLRGSERVDIASVLTVLGQVSFMVLAGIFLYFRLGFIWLFVASLINMPITIALQVWSIRRNKLSPPRFKINPQLWRHVIVAGLPFGFIQLSTSFAFRVDTIILSTHVPDAQIGFYRAAYNLVFTILGVSTSFNQAILPTLTREHGLNPQTVKTWYYNSVRVMVFICLPIAIGTTLVSYDITVLLYEPSFAPSAIALAILIWDLPFVMYHSFCGNVTQSINRERAAARIYGTLGIFNLLINLAFVPRFGIIGSSFATVLTDFLGAAQYYFLLRHEFGAGLGFTRLMRLVLSVMMMGLVVFLMIGLPLLIVIPIAALCYLTLVWLSGAFTQEERERLTHFVTRKLRLNSAYRN